MPVRRIRMLPTYLLPLLRMWRVVALHGAFRLAHGDSLDSPPRYPPSSGRHKTAGADSSHASADAQMLPATRAGAGRWMSDQLSQLRASHAEQLRHLQAAATEEKAAATADLVARLAAVRAWTDLALTESSLGWSRPSGF